MITSKVKVEDIGLFRKLIDGTKPFLSKKVEADYEGLNDKYRLLSILNRGFDFFPSIYREPFLVPLKNLIETQVFTEVLKTYFSDGRNVLGDWISSIDQRITNIENAPILPTMAFTELCSDIYDGYVSRTARKNAALPEYQIIAPLTRWGGTDIYTHSARVGTSLGIKISIVSIPRKWSQNIALWPLSVHECYHDVIDAYEGLLNEVEDMIAETFESPKVKKQFTESMNYNGETRKCIAEFASEYWRKTMSETLADIFSVLNVGPSSGISLALFAISQDSNLTPSSYVDDPHPDTVLRIVLAREVIRRLIGLDIKVRNDYIKYLNKILEKFVYKKEELILYTKLYGEGKNYDIIVPFSSMEKTVEIVVEKVAFTRLKSLGNHSLSEINTWTNRDQVLVERIVDDLLKGEVPHLRKGPDEQEVYAAHIVAGATIALTNKPDIQSITDLAHKSLANLYKTNPVWGGFPVAYRSDVGQVDTIVSK